MTTSERQRQIDDELFMENMKIANPDLYARWMAGPRFKSPDAEDTVTIYGALRLYLRTLSQQPDEDLETIARVIRLMIAIKPQAVEASQEIASRKTS